ncbi:DUF418 domain-containing protein [Streptomyces capillispiralis]|uniref:DUF418 domain-containing protein n=1 Tax=Streptomyces capillispiralis TaxID=68182 RepID=UPI0036AF24F4
MRTRAIDALRGFALAGILPVNAFLLSGAHGRGHLGDGGLWADWLPALLVTTALEMKFYLLFSFVFGYSFALTLPRGHAPARHGRRLVALFALGAVHAVVLFPGDILTTYAVLGVVLILVRSVSARTLLRVAGGLLVLFVGLLLAIGLWSLALGPWTAADIAAVEAGERALAGRYQQGPAQTILENARMSGVYVVGGLLAAPDILFAMLCGLVAGRRGLAEQVARQPALQRRAVLTGLAGGLPLALFAAVCTHGPLGREWIYVGKAANAVSAPLLAAAYAAGLFLLWRSVRGKRLCEALAVTGRLSLTHYLTQSLVMASLFTGLGLGLYGRWSGAAVLGLCVALYAAQVWISVLACGRVPERPVRGPAERLVSLVGGRRGVRRDGPGPLRP